MIASKSLRILAFTSLLCALPFAAQAKKPAAAAPKADAPAAAADPAKPGATPAPAAATERKLPYAGTVDVVDKQKQTFTFKETKGERTFIVTPTTKIENVVTKQPAKFDDITVTSYVTGSYIKKGETLEAYSVHLGKTAPVPGAKKGAAAKGATPAKGAAATPAAKP